MSVCRPFAKPNHMSRTQVLKAPSLSRIPWLVHGFSTRKGGSSRPYRGSSLNLGFTSHDSRVAVLRNRQAFVSALAGARNASGIGDLASDPFGSDSSGDEGAEAPAAW